MSKKKRLRRIEELEQRAIALRTETVMDTGKVPEGKPKKKGRRLPRSRSREAMTRRRR